MRKLLMIVIFFSLFIIAAGFAAFNMQAVTVSFYFFSLSLPMAVWLLISLLAGLALGAILIYLSSLRLRLDNHRLRHKLDVAEEELNSLRILPVKDGN